MIKVTTHIAGVNFGTFAVIRVGRKRIEGPVVGLGFEKAAVTAVLTENRSRLSLDQAKEVEEAWSL